jgi:16S rRNA pseudouridine516 synthase
VPRLDILLARNLGLSRREVTKLLRRRAVRDDAGSVLDDGRRNVEPAGLPCTVVVDDASVVLRARMDLLQHKPVGVVTALRDDRHATAYALLAGAPLFAELRAVGRLDRDASGLLLWTTDGTLLHRLTHPRWAVPRTYHAALRREFREPPADLVLDDGHRPRIAELRALDPAQAHPALARPEDATVLATLTICSGRFHEVKRIFLALGSEVVALCRVAYGPIALPNDLPAGAWTAVDLRAAFRGISPVDP